MKHRRFDLVIFDKDGTLVDLDLTWGPPFAQMLRSVTMSPEDRHAIADRFGFDQHSSRFAGHSDFAHLSNTEFADAVATLLGIPNDRALATQIEMALAPTGSVTPFEVHGATSVLRQIRASGSKVALATNDSEQGAITQLERLGWQDHFDIIFGYNSGYGTKPDAGMLEAAARKSGASRHRSVMVGDTTTDVLAGKAASVRTVLIGPATSQPAADRTIRSLAELPTLLRDWR